MEKIPVISFIGWSGAGKTTFIERLLAYWKKTGIRVAVIKEIPKAYQMDTKGKDTWRYAQAGAEQILVVNPQTGMLIENRPMSFEDMLKHVHDVDIVLTEGHQDLGYPQVEIYRREVCEGLRCLHRNQLIAVITDCPLSDSEDIRQFGFEELENVAAFLQLRCGAIK